MSTDTTDVVRQGYLRCRGRTNFGMWQKRWIVLRANSSKGPCRLEKYADERTARSNGFVLDMKMDLLNSVASVYRVSTNVKKHAFNIEFNTGRTKSFACDSDLEADNWVKELNQECFTPINTTGIANGEPDILAPGMLKELQERFRVFLRPSSRLEVFGECLLQVTHENIYLWDAVNHKLKLATWPLTSLRRYGSDQSKFTFEAGRHCPTGEGMFIFHTFQGEKIYRKVHQATVAIAEAHQKLRKENAAYLAAVASHQQPQSSVSDTAAASFYPPSYLMAASYDHHQEQQSASGDNQTSWYHSDSSEMSAQDSLPAGV